MMFSVFSTDICSASIVFHIIFKNIFCQLIIIVPVLQTITLFLTFHHSKINVQ